MNDSESFKIILTFIVISFVIAILIDGATYRILGRGFTSSHAQFIPTREAVIAIVWGFTRMYSVAFSALVTFLMYRYPVRRFLSYWIRFKGGRRAFIFYLLAPIATFISLAIVIEVSALANIVRLDVIYGYGYPLILIFAYISSITINTFFALGEEIGWRGLLQDFLEFKYGFQTATILTGLVWGLWHVPAILILGYFDVGKSVYSAIGFVIWVIFLAIPHALIRRYSSGIVPSASLHGSINAV